jgi:hypothetical protein
MPPVGEQAMPPVAAVFSRTATGNKRVATPAPNTAEEPPAADLPGDIITVVFSYISLPDVVRASAVSKHWNEIARSKEVCNNDVVSDDASFRDAIRLDFGELLKLFRT